MEVMGEMLHPRPPLNILRNKGERIPECLDLAIMTL